MDLDDLQELPSESAAAVAAAAAATALLLAPPVRRAVRQVAVLGLAGLLAAGERVSGWASRVVGSPAQTGAADDAFARDLARDARRELARLRLADPHAAPAPPRPSYNAAQ